MHSSTLAYLKTLADADLNRVIVTPWGPSYPLIEMLEHLIEHEIHHRAELSLISGCLGGKVSTPELSRQKVPAQLPLEVQPFAYDLVDYAPNAYMWMPIVPRSMETLRSHATRQASGKGTRR